jgi:hypothetical protein
MKPRKDMHRTLAATPLAYFITLRTYGTWLHGDDRGTVALGRWGAYEP